MKKRLLYGVATFVLVFWEYLKWIVDWVGRGLAVRDWPEFLQLEIGAFLFGKEFRSHVDIPSFPSQGRGRQAGGEKVRASM